MIPQVSEIYKTSRNGLTMESYPDGRYKIYGTATANTQYCIDLKDGKFYSNVSSAHYSHLDTGDYIFHATMIKGERVSLRARDSSTNLTPFGVNGSFTLENATDGFHLYFYDQSGAEVDLEFKIMLEKGSTVHEWEEYSNEEASPNPNFEQQIQVVKGNNTITVSKDTQSQIYPITLPEGMEMCKIGDYTDEFVYQDAKWYKNHKIYKFILTGNEDWRLSNNVFYISSGFPNYLMLENVNKVFCNKYLGIEPVYTAGYVTNNNVCCITKNHSLKRVYITDSRFDNVEDFKSYLVEQYVNGTPVIIYYILGTPELEKITDTTLITQLNNIKEAYTYQGQTNITQESVDLPFIIKADFKLSNLSRIEALEQAIN